VEGSASLVCEVTMLSLDATSFIRLLLPMIARAGNYSEEILNSPLRILSTPAWKLMLLSIVTTSFLLERVHVKDHLLLKKPNFKSPAPVIKAY